VRPLEVELLEGIGDGQEPALWIASHGFESRSLSHLQLDSSKSRTRISIGFDFPDVDDLETSSRISKTERMLQDAGFSTTAASDEEFDQRISSELSGLRSEDFIRVVADVSCMNRSRISSLVLLCSQMMQDCDLDVIYFPSTFESHKHEYEPLESLGPVHDDLAGWPMDTDLPLALIVGMGTEPGRAEGIMEFLEPDIISLFEPIGDDEGFSNDIRHENKRVIDVAAPSTKYVIRDPENTYGLLSAAVDRLSSQARLILVPMGPKLFCVLSVVVAISHGVGVGVWRASAGKGIRPVDVKSSGAPVITRIKFRVG
jgi:hypothetical protein